MPKLPEISIAKILLGIFLLVLALAVGIALGTVAFRITNPNKQISIGPITTGPPPSPLPTPTLKPSPSPSPTVVPIPLDWETYTNEVLGFTFKYPPNVELTEGDLRGGDISDTFVSPAEYTYGVTLKITDLEFIIFASSVNINKDNLPLDIEKKANALVESSESELSITQVDFAGSTAYKVNTEDSPILLYFIFSLGKDQTSEISITVTADSSSAEVIEQIIGSFQFLN